MHVAVALNALHQAEYCWPSLTRLENVDPKVWIFFGAIPKV